MNRFLTPLKREFWEYRGTFIWFPVVASGLIAALMIGALTLYASGAISYVFEDDDFRITSSRQHQQHTQHEALIIKREALQEARQEINKARQEIAERFDEEINVDINRELDAAQKELDAQGIDITIKRERIEINHEKVQVEVRRQLDRELQRIDQEIASIDRQLAQGMRTPPSAPAVPKIPATATTPGAPETPTELRTFPETVTVIAETDGLGFTDKNIESVNDVVKGFFTLFSVLMLLVSIFYLTNCLYADRKDNSILFWKSMPVSELQHVLTKLGVGIFALPSIAALAGLAIAIVFVILTMFYVTGYSSSTTPWEILLGVNVFGTAFSHWLTALCAAIWCLPFFGWLLFVSAAAKRSPLFLAILPPVALITAEEMLFDTQILLNQIAARLPSLTIDDNGYSGYVRFAESPTNPLMDMLATPGTWGGLIAGTALIYAAVWLRNNRYEI